MHLHAFNHASRKIRKNMNSRLKASSYADFPGNNAKMLGQSDFLSFNCQPRGLVKLAKYVCTIYARN